MIFTEARRQRLENAALVEQEEMLSAALQELPHTLKLLYKSLNKKDTTRARKILGLICGQMGMVATHLGAEREASLLSRLWKQLRGGGGAAAGMAGTEAVEADESGTKVVDRVGRYFLVSYPGRRTTRGKNADWWEARYTTKGGTEAKFALITLPTDAKDENDYTVSVGTLKPSTLAMDFDSLGDAFRKAIKWWEKHHAGTEALEAMDNPDWIKAAEKLLTANKGKTQDDFYYRAYLRAIIAKKPAKHLVSKYPAAKQAQADLIDAAGKGDS